MRIRCFAFAATALIATTLPGSSQVADHDHDLHVNRPVRVPPTTQNAEPPCGSFACSNVRLLSQVTLSEFPGNQSSGNDVWGYVSPSGREYAVMGLRRGTGFVEITDPENPVVLGVETGPTSTWRDMKVYDEYVYSVSEGGTGDDGDGIKVYDVSNIDNGVINYVGDVTSGGTEDSHNVALDEVSGFLYRCGGSSNGLRIYDLNASKTNPPFVASWSSEYVHDAQIVTYTSGPYAGRQIAFCCTGSDERLFIVDVTNKSNIFVRDSLGYPNSGYSHQGWLSEDRQFFYLNDEFDEPPLDTTTYVFNVSNLDNISYSGAFDNNNSAIGHNGYVRGDFLYEANYTSGLRVFDIGASATNPPEVAWFDTYPANDSADYCGLWGCFPLFPSGVVLGSDTDRGLFMWWVGPPALAIDFPNGNPSMINGGGDSILVEITPQSGQAVGSATLHYDAGSGFVTAPLVPQGGNLYEAQFPSLPCDINVDYYVSATSTYNITWTNPEDAPTDVHTTTTTCGGVTYCTPKLNSCIGVPAISFNGTSSASASSGFDIDGSDSNFNKAGILLYTDMGRQNIPFQGGTLCVAGPVRRTVVVSSTGGSPGTCTSTMSIDMNAFAQGLLGGGPKAFLLIVGQQVNVQWWGRDTVANGSYLTDGGEYFVGP